MKRIRPFRLAVCLLMGAGAILSSCTSDEPTPLPKPNLPGRQGVVIINQGNAYTNLPGSLDYVDFQHDTKQQGVFAQANGGNSLGMSPQNGIAYGSNIYLAVYGDNLVRVIDRTTFRQKATISISQPEAVYAGAGSIYVADNTGYVTRFDTLSWSKQASVAVGPNPAALAGANGLLYVSISDGYNSSGGYANGFRVVRLDPQTLQKRDEIKVGMNPGELCADANGTVYVVCRGDDSATPSRTRLLRRHTYSHARLRPGRGQLRDQLDDVSDKDQFGAVPQPNDDLRSAGAQRLFFGLSGQRDAGANQSGFG